ncbi:MAG: hypothetical protein ACOX9E_01360 [Lentisphaeria bacterium]
MVKRLRRNVDMMDDNTCLPVVHIVHSSLQEQQLSMGGRLPVFLVP